jgi:hypothetical protein
MNHLIRTIMATLVVGVCCASLASAQTQNNIRVPSAQRALSNILSKYSRLYDAAPNDIQKSKILSSYRQKFCANLPRGGVSGWVGDVWKINDNTPNKGIYLDMEVSIENLQTSADGALGIGLWLGNSDASDSLRVGSPLYNTASTLRNGDAVIFSGAFVPFSSPQACFQSLSGSTDFSFRFSSIRKVGSDLMLE